MVFASSYDALKGPLSLIVSERKLAIVERGESNLPTRHFVVSTISHPLPALFTFPEEFSCYVVSGPQSL